MSRKEEAPLGLDGVLKVIPEENAIRLPSGLLLRYDDLDFDTAEKGVEFHYKAYVEKCMRWVPDWAEGLPINCESGTGKSYGDCE